ncbi:Calcium/calmodulin-dependent protein kinase type 1G [Diplodia seriata]|uniref:Calcium/calmodulin-dependent protein kinase type 1G n=1 Tax=Diplodia seriata TaxID=420778 RepID=A0A1S8BAW5_9PEZI|nr:Calcium/calmodulin-dependent protein kinase type 1G [Diplodia seriata]
MGQPRFTTEEFENAISGLITLASDESSVRARFDDETFDKITNLLACVGRPEWSLRPRTYALLRMINRPDYMHQFVHHGLRDIHLPYDNLRLPSFLDDASRHMFMEKQSSVLTKANALELENGRHRHFDSSADCHFLILGTLGRGKFGVVDHVQSKLSINRFARKRIYRARSAIRDKEATKSFENELENLKRLRHHHLVTYIGSYTDPHYVGILTIPVADCDLQRFLQQNPFPINNASLLRQFFGCLCSAVQYLHLNKCRHKDIKPGNILVKNGQVYLTDFGTARDWSDRTKATTVGPSGPYTPRFAAPEVVNWEPRNETADIWSLGCVYLDMLVREVDTLSHFVLRVQRLIAVRPLSRARL